MLDPLPAVPLTGESAGGQPPRLSSAGPRMALLTVGGLLLAMLAAASLSLSLAHARTIRFPHPSIAISQGANATSLVDQPITFQVSVQSGSELTFEWAFADNTPSVASSTTSATHTFETYGQYRVVVTARDPLGQTTTAETDVIVRPTPPVAAFTMHTEYASYYAVCVQFDAASSYGGTPLTYTWDFGNGQTSGNSQDAQPSECYYGAGTYVVTLTVMDTMSQTSTVSHTLTVNP